MAQVTIAEPAFLFELLALIGAGLGIAFGTSHRYTLVDLVDTASRTAEPGDPDDFWEVVSLLGADSDTLEQRWAMIQTLTSTTTQELPLSAFVVRLSEERYPSFPDDETDVRRLVRTHLPALTDRGLVDCDDEVGTVRYVGPEYVVDYVSAEP